MAIAGTAALIVLSIAVFSTRPRTLDLAAAVEECHNAYAHQITSPEFTGPVPEDLARKLGDRLVGLHLMEKFGKITTRYPVSGNDMVEKIDYTSPADAPEQGRVWINKTQYIEGVPLEVWEFHIGGYQVCQKWMKDRKGRKLEFNDIKHYQRMVAALAETIQLMGQIDEIIDEHGGWPIQ